MKDNLIKEKHMEKLMSQTILYKKKSQTNTLINMVQIKKTSYYKNKIY